MPKIATREHAMLVPNYDVFSSILKDERPKGVVTRQSAVGIVGKLEKPRRQHVNVR